VEYVQKLKKGYSLAIFCSSDVFIFDIFSNFDFLIFIDDKFGK
jgi:hypothetical protein